MFVDRVLKLECIHTQDGPRTAAVFDGVELINKMEHVYWGDLVQTQVYHGLYDNDIVYGNYVELSCLNAQVVWSVPRIDIRDEWERTQFWPPRRLVEEGLIVFAEKVWKQLCVEDRDVITLSQIAPLRYEQLLWTWLWRWFVDQRIFGVQELVPYVRRLIVASSTLETQEALGMLKHLIAVMTQPGAATGRLLPLAQTNAMIEVMYLDGPPCEEVALFALWRGQACPIIGSSWMFVPD